MRDILCDAVVDFGCQYKARICCENRIRNERKKNEQGE